MLLIISQYLRLSIITLTKFFTQIDFPHFFSLVFNAFGRILQHRWYHGINVTEHEVKSYTQEINSRKNEQSLGFLRFNKIEAEENLKIYDSKVSQLSEIGWLMLKSRVSWYCFSFEAVLKWDDGQNLCDNSSVISYKNFTATIFSLLLRLL